MKFFCSLSVIFIGFLGSLNALDIRPTPYFTEEAIVFVDKYLKEHPHAKVLEFGSGASTIWLAKRTKNLYSVENNGRWFRAIKDAVEKDKRCFPMKKFILRKKPYYEVCKLFKDNFFDVIIVDGRNRKGCIHLGLSKLKKGGLLVLDNSERQRYKAILPRMKGWAKFEAVQTKPDRYGFWYRNWKTTCWIKP